MPTAASAQTVTATAPHPYGNTDLTYSRHNIHPYSCTHSTPTPPKPSSSFFFLKDPPTPDSPPLPPPNALPTNPAGAVAPMKLYRVEPPKTPAPDGPTPASTGSDRLTV